MTEYVKLTYEESVFLGNMCIQIERESNEQNITFVKHPLWNDHKEFILSKSDELEPNWLFHPDYILEIYDTDQKICAREFYKNAPDHIKIYLKLKWGFE